MKLELNLEKIQECALQKKEENQRFRVFLAKEDGKAVDLIVNRLFAELEPQISCVECGNCCKNMRPATSDAEMLKFVDKDKIESLRYEPNIQCKYLDGKKCSIYLDRYPECKTFPYLNVTGFQDRMVGMFQFYEMCPQIYNVLEHMKKEMKWCDVNEER